MMTRKLVEWARRYASVLANSINEELEARVVASLCKKPNERKRRRIAKKPELSLEETEELLKEGRQEGLEVEKDLEACTHISPSKWKHRVR